MTRYLFAMILDRTARLAIPPSVVRERTPEWSKWRKTRHPRQSACAYPAFDAENRPTAAFPGTPDVRDMKRENVEKLAHNPDNESGTVS